MAEAMRAPGWMSQAAAELHRKVIEMDPTNMQARYQQGRPCPYPPAPSIRPPLIVCRGLAALIELSVGAHASAQHHLEQALTARPKPQEPELFIKLGEACDAQATPEGYDAALQVTAPQHYALPKTDDSLRLPAL